MSWKDLMAAYFSFGKKDRMGLFCLVFLVILAYFLPHLFPEQAIDEPILAEELLVFEDSVQNSGKRYQGYVPIEQERKTPETFAFDPNKLDGEGWSRLGLSDRTIKTIMNFRNKGGKFYKPEDLQRIWGLPGGFYERVKDQINIELSETANSYPESKFEKKKYPVTESININTADSAGWEKLPGIGPKLASRINSFRNKLGGFYSAEQVGETYGLPDSTFQKIRPFLVISGEVKKININNATKEELSAHPYIRWKIANAIIEYKNQHGNFTSLEELKKILIVDEKNFLKLLPYLSL